MKRKRPDFVIFEIDGNKAMFDKKKMAMRCEL